MIPSIVLATAAGPPAGSGAALAAIVVVLFLLRTVLVEIGRRAEGAGGDRWLVVETAVARGYLALLHRARFEGFDRIETSLLADGPLLVVANHTCGLDPVLLQMPIPRRVRWMMWTGQMGVGLGWLWRHLQVLPVGQDGRDLASVRNALRSLRDGEVIGIFPEGGVERPPGVLKPFEPGLGVMAVRSNAPVLLCLIEGTPAPRIFGSLITPSRSCVRAIGVFRPESGEAGAAFLARLATALEAAGSSPDAVATDPEGGARQ